MSLSPGVDSRGARLRLGSHVYLPSDSRLLAFTHLLASLLAHPFAAHFACVLLDNKHMALSKFSPARCSTVERLSVGPSLQHLTGPCRKLMNASCATRTLKYSSTPVHWLSFHLMGVRYYRNKLYLHCICPPFCFAVHLSIVCSSGQCISVSFKGRLLLYLDGNDVLG